MRFKPIEHSAIVEVMADHGIDPGAVLFVKRKGWLHVQLPDRITTFAFHRKKRTVLDKNGQWHDVVEYMIHAHGRTTDGLDLAGMITVFERWLEADR